VSTITDSQTSSTLLRRLRGDPTDQTAWAEFVERYGRLIYRWSRHWGLQETDAEDVTQSVLLELVREMRTFTYDSSGSFRGWLHTIARRVWARFLENRKRLIHRESEAMSFLLLPATGEDFRRHLEEESDRELLEKAMAMVSLRVQPHTWEAFRLLALEGWSGAMAAQKLGIKVGTVFVARSKVQQMLREEVQRLNGEETG
jgi:RNA polymerase sigma-70 factor (ECF subfamily)